MLGRGTQGQPALRPFLLFFLSVLFAETPELHAVTHPGAPLSVPRAMFFAGISPRLPWVLLAFVMVAAAASLSIALALLHSKSRQLDAAVKAARSGRGFEIARVEVLESIARNAPLPESVERIALAIEKRLVGSACLIALASSNRSVSTGPVMVAPSLPEEIQAKILPLLSSELGAWEKNIADPKWQEKLLRGLLDALQRSGLEFTEGNQSAVPSPNGMPAGRVVLFFKNSQTEDSQIGNENLLVWASRLVSLAIEHCSMHERLLHDARHDILTGLPNRAVAEDRLEQALARAQRHKKVFAVLCIDLDGFKGINDELGHQTGDEVLRVIGGRLRSRIRHSDTLARVGGDEFWAIIEDCPVESAARVVAQSLITALETPVTVGAQQLHVSASIGITMYPADAGTATELKRQADQAMYRAKSLGGRRISFASEVPDSGSKTGMSISANAT